MAFNDIPDRENDKDFLVDASWFNSIKKELVAAFGNGGLIKEANLQIIADGGEIAVDPAAFKPLIPVISDGGTVTASITPFGTAHGFQGGKEIILLGTSDVDIVELTVNDIDDGIISNGKIVLTRFDQIILIYNEGLKRFIRKE